MTRRRALLLASALLAIAFAGSVFQSDLIGWWRGDFSLADARSAGMVVQGRREWVRAFPKWFERYAFASVAPALAD